MQKRGNKYGTHRVLEPSGVLPQPALRVSNDFSEIYDNNDFSEIYDNEILCDVITLNIDSASFSDIKDRSGMNQEEIARIMPMDWLGRYVHW